MLIKDTYDRMNNDTNIFNQIYLILVETQPSAPLTTMIFANYNQMAREYYYNHSGLKSTAPIYDYMQEYGSRNTIENIARIITPKYVNKWTRLCDALILKENLYVNYSRTRTLKQSKSISESENANNTANTTIDRTFQNVDQKTGGNVHTRDTYPFNTNNKVTTESNNDSINEEVTSNSSEDTTNTSTNQYNSTKTISADADGNVTSEEISGHDGSIIDEITKEIEFLKNNIYDIIYDDIDSVLAATLYAFD